jgi:hypothetical protein
MPTEQPQDSSKPRRPRGRAVRWTESDIEAMSEVTPADMERAARLIDRYGSRRLRAMQDAHRDTR